MCKDAIFVFLRKTRRTEYRHTWSGEVELAETIYDLEENAKGPAELEATILRPLEELPDLRDRRRLAPVGRRSRRPPLKRLDNRGGVHRLGHIVSLGIVV